MKTRVDVFGIDPQGESEQIRTKHVLRFTSPYLTQGTNLTRKQPRSQVLLSSWR